MQRRDFLTGLLAGAATLRLDNAAAQQTSGNVFFERAAEGSPHKDKELATIPAHSDDIPLTAAGPIAKLVKEGYTGYLIRATNDDMGDARGLGTPGTIGENVLGNERDNDEVARVLGLKRVFNLNYNNHKMGDVSLNELICRLILLIRALKVDTVVCWDPWAHDEENPDHHMIARGVEAACWMAGRDHDYPEQFAAGLQPYEVRDKYYFARRPEITRVVDISAVVDKKVEANRANQAKGPGGHHGSQLRANWRRKTSACRCWGTTTPPPTAITSRSSSWSVTANWDGSTASNTPRRSTMSPPELRVRRDRAPRSISGSTSCH